MAAKQFLKQNQDGKTFVRINRRTRRGHYTILPKSSQHKYCEKIVLEGFDRLPAGFYANDGFGLTGAGVELFEEIARKYDKKISLTVTAQGKFRVDGRGRTVTLVIPHKLLSKLNADKRTIRSQRASEVRAAIQAFLATNAPRQFGEYRDTKPAYAPGTLTNILARDGVTAGMNPDDEKAVQEFIPRYLSEIKGTLRSSSKMQIIFDSLDAGRKIYLDKVLHEFKKKLANKVQNETVWQDFLKQHILIFRHTYGEVLDRSSIKIIEGKYPDFMLIDPYSYVDVYEIKTPATALMTLDRSRNNYYWSTELSKAIAQVEKYLYEIQRHSDTFKVELHETKRIDINVVRPRGYIVAGKRADITSGKMRSDFRILNESLKNIDVILYDDLVSNLEAFLSKLKAE